MDKLEIACNRGELKRLRNESGESKLADAIEQTALLRGADGYIEAVRAAVSQHGVAAAILVRDDDDPLSCIPLAWANPGVQDDKILPGGLLATFSDRAIVAWQQAREGGFFGMYNACACVIAYDTVLAATADMSQITVATPDRNWVLVVRSLDGKKRALYRESITPHILSSFRRLLDVGDDAGLRAVRVNAPPSPSSAPDAATDGPLADAGRRVCMSPGCDASGLATSLSTCDVCGRATGPEPASPPTAQLHGHRESPAVPAGYAGLYACANSACNAVRLQAPIPSCDVCGHATVPIAAAPQRSCRETECVAYGRPARGAFCGSCGVRTVAI